MSGDVRRLPPIRIRPHFEAAFGGAFGALNLLVGAVSVARQLAHAFNVGLSPVLKGIFASYVQIFHGLVDFFAGTLTWLSGYSFSVPPWAHDWVVLWFVGAGTVFRLVQATKKAMAARNFVMVIREDEDYHANSPGGAITNFLVRFRLPGSGLSSKLLTAFVAYLLTVFVWWIVLLEVHVVPPMIDNRVTYARYRMSFAALFWLQTAAIVLAIFGLSVLNAQTM